MPTHIKAEIILQSTNEATGDTLTTFKLEYPRIIEAELNTHTLLRGSTSSSRAVNINKMCDRLRQISYTPEEWGVNRSGMSATETVDPKQIPLLKKLWENHRDQAINLSETLADLKIHKQIANRVTEPYQIIQKILTGTCWANFFDLRDSKNAQPEIRELAHEMKEAMEDSIPNLLSPGEWHMPFIDVALLAQLANENKPITNELLISVARCARVSYLKDRTFSIADDLDLAKRLYTQRHVKPFTHVAVTLPDRVMVDSYIGFMNLRKFIPDETNGDDLNVPILNGEQAREKYCHYLGEVTI